jgi:hypothetical protein
MAESYDDTVRIRVLPECAMQQEAAMQQDVRDGAPERGFDPYSNDVGALNVQPSRRRTLDDMRRLSEAILRNRRSAK